MIVNHQVGDEISFRSETSSMSYRYGGIPKPCVHSVAIGGSSAFTGYEMSDHPWHRGLWFTFKYLNGQNFWEEGDDCPGVQRSVGIPEISTENDKLKIRHNLEWIGLGGEAFLDEKRSLTSWQIDPGSLAVQWEANFTARTSVKIDRTPFTTWGGYGGLAFRAGRECHEVSLLTDADDEPKTLITGAPSPWVAMNVRFDGGSNRYGGIALIDHPNNLRYPSPIYARCTNPGFSFSNLAVLFNEPFDAEPGKPFSIRQLAVFRTGPWTRAQVKELAASFASDKL
jgi:hypothetical protein